MLRRAGLGPKGSGHAIALRTIPQPPFLDIVNYDRETLGIPRRVGSWQRLGVRMIGRSDSTATLSLCFSPRFEHVPA